MNNSTLQLYPEPSADALSQQFSLIGTVDVNAIPVLEGLYKLPAHCSVELDFAMVQRVNSMGLAQLLKLFQHWEAEGIAIRVINANRMIMVLFKMTGLTRFLADGQTEATVTVAAPFNQAAAPQRSEPAVVIPPIATVAPTTNAQMLAFGSKKIAPIPAANADSASPEKLKLWVNAQSNQQMNGWFFFNTYLQRHLGREIQMELVQGAISPNGEPIEKMDMVFTTPFMAARLALEHHFRPLARPLDQTDEVTIVARAVDEGTQRLTLADFHHTKVVTAAADNFIYLLGRFLLEEAGVSSHYLFSGHDIKALQLLLKGHADLLLMATDSYRALTGMTRKMLREVDRSETGFAFHLFCLAPHHLELAPALSNVLLKMHQDPQGRQVLKDLNIEAWNVPKADEISMMEMLFKRYANTTATTPAPNQAAAALAVEQVRY